VEFRHLRYFVAVAEALNYRRAAERLRVAQPSLSKQIKDLEAKVGARLLNRNTGGVSLTDAGATLLEEARDILERVEMAAEATREAEAGRGGRLTIGSLGAISASFLPASLAAFRERFPRVEVNLHETSVPDQIAALNAGLVQLAFTTDQDLPTPPTFESAEVLATRLVLAMNRGHRLARRLSVPLADVAEEPFLFIGETEHHDRHRMIIDAIFDARGIRHRPIKRVNGYESLVALVAGGHGLSVLLPFPRSRGKDQIVFRRIQEDGDDLVLRLFAVWRRGSGSQLARNFVDVLRSTSTIPKPAPTSRGPKSRSDAASSS
jgi:DNA-binding transcriptional LysR family regulator